MRRYFFGTVLILMFFTLGDTAFAAMPEAPNRLDPIVFTATKTPKKLENVPAVMTIIGPEQIESMPARTVGDILADLPGVYPHEPQGAGVVTPQSISIGGNGFPGATLILLDGQKINTPFTDYAYLTTIPIRTVNRIEVIRGPFSALYGSSAGGGIINVITKDGGTESHVTPWAQTGNFGRYDHGVDAGIVWGDFSLGLFYDHKEVDNYYLYDDKGMDDRNRDYEHDRFHGKLTGRLGDATRFSLSGGWIDGCTGFGISDTLGLDNYQDVEHPYLNFQATSRVTERLEVKTQVDWLRSTHKYHGETLENVTMVNVGPPPPAPPVMVPRFNYKSSLNDTESDRYRADISGNYYFNDNNILTLGSEIVYTEAEKATYDTATGSLLDVQGRNGEKIDEDDTLFSLYAQYDWMFHDKFELVLGARFDDYDSYGSEFSPKGTLTWNYRNGGILKFSVGKGFKAPNLSQLHSPAWSIAPFMVYQGNPDLDAETLWSYQASLEQRAFNNKLFFRMTPYYTDAENFISSVRRPDPSNPGGQIMQPENVDEVEIKGVDLELSYDIHRRITLFANYNYNETRDGKTDDILDGYPKNSAAMGFRTNHCLGRDFRLFSSYSARYRDDYTVTSWGYPPVKETVGNYWYHSAGVGLHWKEMVKLNADVFNIFNDRTGTDIDSYLPECNYLVSLAFTYRF